MACNTCKTTTAFREKLGRCRQCMWQLAILSAVSWAAWWHFYAAQPTIVESITLMFAASAFSLLLATHLLIACIRRLRGKV